jgi:chromosome segregation ATPase
VARPEERQYNPSSMTGPELLQLLQDPELRQSVRAALGLPTDSVAESLRQLAAAQARTEARVQELAAAQARTEARVQELAAAQARTEARLEELAGAQARTEARLEELAGAQARTEGSLKELAAEVKGLAAAQARTEASLKELAAEVKGLAAGQRELAVGQKELAAGQKELRTAVGALSDNVGFGLEQLAAIVLPAQLERDERTILTTEFERRLVSTAAGEEEVDLWAQGERDGAAVQVVGEVKSRVYATDVKRFVQKAERVQATLEAPVLRLMFGFVVHPSAREVAEHLGVRVVASRPGA